MKWLSNLWRGFWRHTLDGIVIKIRQTLESSKDDAGLVVFYCLVACLAIYMMGDAMEEAVAPEAIDCDIPEGAEIKFNAEGGFEIVKRDQP